MIMRKIILALTVAAIAAGSAMAQISVGAGYLRQTTTTTVGETSGTGATDGFYAGADFSCHLIAGLSVDPGIYYGYQVGKEDIYNVGIATTTTQSHYLFIPVDFKYSCHVADFLDVFAFAGPRFNVGVASSTTWKVLDVSYEKNHYDEDGDLQRFDLALGAGVGIDLFQMVRIKFGYDWGLLDLNKTDSIQLRNSGWHIGAAFLF